MGEEECSSAGYSTLLTKLIIIVVPSKEDMLLLLCQPASHNFCHRARGKSAGSQYHCNCTACTTMLLKCIMHREMVFVPLPPLP